PGHIAAESSWFLRTVQDHEVRAPRPSRIVVDAWPILHRVLSRGAVALEAAARANGKGVVFAPGRMPAMPSWCSHVRETLDAGAVSNGSDTYRREPDGRQPCA